MRHYTVRLSPEAQTDLVHIYGYVVERSGSTDTADRYIERISGFLSSFDVFPERGTIRDEMRPGPSRGARVWHSSLRMPMWSFYVF